MKNISDFFSIPSRQPDLDFIDIDLDCDNLLFIDPRLIEKGTDALSKEMQNYIEVYWAEVIKAIRSKDKGLISSILGGLKEPAETRLGYSNRNNQGNSVADKLKKKLILAIMRNKAVMSGQLSEFCDFELFIDDVSSDRISDIITKVIKNVLVNYTQRQCRLHGIPMGSFVQQDFFDISSVNWVKSKKVLLPACSAGRPIIFVPKHIVRLQGVAGQNFRCFYRFAIREYIANDREMIKDVSPSGKDGKILLRDVKSKYPISKESLSNWYNRYGKLVVDFKSDILSQRITPLTDAQIMNIVYEDMRSVG